MLIAKRSAAGSKPPATRARAGKQLLRSPRLLTCLLLVLLGGVLAPAGASASSGQLSIMQDDREFLGEFGEDPGRAIKEAKSLGVDVIRVNAIFQKIYSTPKQRKKPADFTTSNPNESRYQWGPLDRLVTIARANDIKLLITVTGPGPYWASRFPNKCKSLPCKFKPNPKTFGQFTAAVAKRYKNKVSMYSLYNEPNLPTASWLSPRYTKGKKVDYAAYQYRKLWQAGYKSIAKYDSKARNHVLFGETAAIGDPMRMLAAALCLDTKGRPFKGKIKKLQGCTRAKKLNIGGFAIHPYNFGGYGNAQKKTKSKGALPLAYLPRLNRLADRAKARGRIGRKSIYSTEFGFQTKPPDRLGVSPKSQARLINESDRLFYGSSRVKGVSQYELVDVKQANQFNTGLRYVASSGGKRKPAYAAYKMPLVVTKKSGSRVEVWGQVRPGGRATVSIQVGSGKGYKAVKSVRTNGRGYFKTTVKRKNASKLRWRTTATAAGQSLASRVAKAGKRLRYYSN